MFLIPNFIEENVEYPCSCCYVSFQCLCWNVVWSCCFATLDLSDDHADFFNCWWVNICWEVRGCCFNVGWVQWGWSVQEFFEVFCPLVSLFFNVGYYLAFLAVQWSFGLTVISREFLCYVTKFSHVSFSNSFFRRHC
ncbi:unnamed protein product [Schistosoma margrebowiei]|uniref:Uncharacterized protein n=1 Tax=Schistosoma margrebowiei TaxID=48269 RepID=A0A3P7XHZ7_9TREM|nr:unnamed protein product [Schistosoma margrebowiei]